MLYLVHEGFEMSTYKLNKGVVDNIESSFSGKSSTDLVTHHKQCTK